MKLHNKILNLMLFLVLGLFQFNSAMVHEDIKDTFSPLNTGFRSLSILPGYLASETELIKNYFRFMDTNSKTHKLMEMLFDYSDGRIKRSGRRVAMNHLSVKNVIIILTTINEVQDRKALYASILDKVDHKASESKEFKGFLRALIESLYECEVKHTYVNNFTKTLLLAFLSMKITNKTELEDLLIYFKQKGAFVKDFDPNAKFTKRDLAELSCLGYLRDIDNFFEQICYLYFESVHSTYPTFVADCKILPTFFKEQIIKHEQDRVLTFLPMNCMESSIRNLFNFILKDKGSPTFNAKKLWNIGANHDSPGVKFYEQNPQACSAIANCDDWNNLIQNIPGVYYERRIKIEKYSLSVENSCACNPPYNKPSYLANIQSDWICFGAMPQGEDVMESNFITIINHLFGMNLTSLEHLRDLLLQRLNISMTWVVGDPIEISNTNARGKEEKIIYRNARGKEHRELLITFTKLQDNSTCTISLKPTHAQSFFGREDLQNCEITQQINAFISANIEYLPTNPNMQYLMCMCHPTPSTLDKINDIRIFIYSCMACNLENNEVYLNTISSIINFIRRCDMGDEQNLELVFTYLKNIFKVIKEHSSSVHQKIDVILQIEKLNPRYAVELAQEFIGNLNGLEKLEFIQNCYKIPELTRLACFMMESIPTEIISYLKSADIKQTVELLKALSTLRHTNLNVFLIEFIRSEKLSAFIAANKEDTYGSALDNLKSDLMELNVHEDIKKEIERLIPTTESDLSIFS